MFSMEMPRFGCSSQPRPRLVWDPSIYNSSWSYRKCRLFLSCLKNPCSPAKVTRHPEIRTTGGCPSCKTIGKISISIYSVLNTHRDITDNTGVSKCNIPCCTLLHDVRRLHDAHIRVTLYAPDSRRMRASPRIRGKCCVHLPREARATRDVTFGPLCIKKYKMTTWY
jgi:hypothetical protein